MTASFTEKRVKMVDNQIRTNAVTDLRVLDAFLEVPREEFVPAMRRELAYLDEDVEVSAGRYLMQPCALARLVQLAAPGPDDVVLDVGCGSGYSCAILSRLAGSVIALESDEDLATWAGETLAEMSYDNVAVLNEPLAAGCVSEAPFDVIMIGGAVDEVPQALLDQFKDGGRLVAVEGVGNAGLAKIYVKSQDAVAGRMAFNCAVKPLPGFQKEPAFQF